MSAAAEIPAFDPFQFDPFAVEPSKATAEEVDRALRSFAARRANMDYWIGKWLIEADKRRIYQKLGHKWLYQYIEPIYGWEPHTLAERLRVAKKLETLPLTAEALKKGETTYTVVRELTRVAVPENEQEWLDFSRGRSGYEVRIHCRSRDEGDDPNSRPKADARVFPLRFDCTSEEYATITEVIAQVRRELRESLGSAPDDATVLAYILKKQVAQVELVMTVCDSCEDATIRSRGVEVPVAPVAGEVATCHARIVDGQTGRIARRQSPTVLRACRHRAHGRCEVPGCRCTVTRPHHEILWAHGGTSSAENTIMLCDAHHDLHHDGALLIEGDRETGLRFLYADGTLMGEVPSQSLAEAYISAFQALKGTGFDEPAVRAILDVLRKEGTLRVTEDIANEGLRRLGGPKEARRQKEARRERIRARKKSPRGRYEDPGTEEPSGTHEPPPPPYRLRRDGVPAGTLRARGDVGRVDQRDLVPLEALQ